METVSGLHGPAGTEECLKAANFSAKLNYLQQQQKQKNCLALTCGAEPLQRLL